MIYTLAQRANLAMEMDFTTFKSEFDIHGIDAEYISLSDLEHIIEAGHFYMVEQT
jgi:hypothetical protein